ncbi:MAG TPA: hypothetical protein PLY53_15735 [Planctomycetota bacterium]|nr:hypothetical protein [Planctomycetota bacterium]
MKIAIGTTVIASGTASGQPARIVGAAGHAAVEIVPRIGAEAAGVFGRGNRHYVDVVEADYTYAAPDLAQAAIHALRAAALAASGTLVYGDGAGATTVGPARCRAAELAEWIGCGITMRYEIVAQEQEA